MSQRVSRHTISSANRASINDEQKRQKKLENTSTSVNQHGKTAKVFGTTVMKVDLKHQNNKFKLETQQNKVVNQNAAKNKQLPQKQGKGKDSSQYDPAKYGGTDETSSKKEKGDVIGGAQARVGHTNNAGTGGSTASGILPDHYKIQKPVFHPVDQYGYKKLSAAEARRYHDNVDFYKNEIHSKPLPGYTIEDMLKWKGNYEKLERNHQYIQWLFPIPESNGLNMYAQQLFEHEAKAIKENDGAHKRVLKAYKMMLDFYGMQLVDSNHGVVKRASKGWQDRYDHLNRYIQDEVLDDESWDNSKHLKLWSRHNLLRITRILKSLGELGYERFQARWVEFLIDEAVINQALPNLNGQCLMHWVMAVKDDGEREMLYRKANGLDIDQDNTHYGSNSESESEEEGENDLETDGHDDLDLLTKTCKLSLRDSEREQKDDIQFKQGESQTGNQVKHIGDSVKGDSVIKYPLSKPQMDKPCDDHMNDQQKPLETSALIEQSNVIETTNTSSMLAAKPKNGKQNVQQVKDETNIRSTDVIASSSDKVTQGTNLSCDNLKFYQNNLHSRPTPGYVIETMLRYKGDYDFFDEKYPEFIQWLFPIPDSVGRNTEAQALSEYEAKEIRNDDELSNRVLRAFEMMLDYFGMELFDNVVGKFRRKKKTYKKRYNHLEKYPVNFLRISRIIKSIGELGFERFQVPWIDFLIDEGKHNDCFPVLDGQIIKYWIVAIKDEGERQAMFKKYEKELQYREERDDDYDDFDSRNTGRTSPLFLRAEIARWLP